MPVISEGSDHELSKVLDDAKRVMSRISRVFRGQHVSEALFLEEMIIIIKEHIISRLPNGRLPDYGEPWPEDSEGPSPSQDGAPDS